jgi:putative transposase
MYYSSDLANWHGERVQVAYCPSDASQVWIRALDSGLLITVAKLNGNSGDYFAQTKLEEKRDIRAKGQLKRMELKIHEIELERQGPQTVLIEHSQAVLAKATPLQLVRETLESPEVRPVFSLPSTPSGKYEYWCQIDARIRDGGEIIDDERRFYTHFQNTAAWKSERMFDPTVEALQAAK